MHNLKQKGIALYYQIEEYIREKIENDEWPKGYQIPSEPELSDYFKVSRSTIRQAISDLVVQGLLIRKQGSGTYVAEPPFKGDYIKSYFPEEVGNFHRLLKINHIDCSSSIAHSLELKLGSRLTEICRLRYLRDEKEPAILEKSYYESALFSGLEKEDFSGRIYDIIENKFNTKLIKAKTLIEPVMLTVNEAAILGTTPTSPVLLLSRICYTNQDRPVILTKSLVRSDKCKLQIVD
ncbi:GntR family transcriptional regulator [Petroclostridium sp. X23]|jgi:GntR family transcriptional regulator|uniref:GntR family transcriptional regulator n=1 Tax=Petroclostridium sp. X23 TaxID=3045146 RepID=UPI0024ACB494|nr:GntR family transcriptional regulator [Petroclostridium sp. X23]WHH58229.1 GntR family transcriptional regulator [Petroclostridium sp. X23]